VFSFKIDEFFAIYESYTNGTITAMSSNKHVGTIVPLLSSSASSGTLTHQTCVACDQGFSTRSVA
ncbi:uncharacterized protein METZ01_LOCUS21509, partial [marine metagenome]